MPFEALLGAAALVAGAIAAVAGFGIGSVLTPVLALQTGTKLAVAAIAIPHAIGTARRCSPRSACICSRAASANDFCSVLCDGRPHTLPRRPGRAARGP